MRTSRRPLARAGVITAAAALLALGVAVPASAHVTVQPTAAPKGSYTEVGFRVPNERDHANTTKLEVFFPTDHPIANVSVQPTTGWTATVKHTKLAKPIKTEDGEVTEAVSEIVWSGGKVAPNQFQVFQTLLGPLPTDTGQLTFKALQTYSTGEVVRWIEKTVPGQPEPANPAPVLHLTAAAASASPSASSGAASSGAASTDAAAGPGSSSVTGSGSGGTSGSGSGETTAALILGIVGAVLGLAGLLLGLGARRRGSAGTPA